VIRSAAGEAPVVSRSKTTKVVANRSWSSSILVCAGAVVVGEAVTSATLGRRSDRIGGWPEAGRTRKSGQIDHRRQARISRTVTFP